MKHPIIVLKEGVVIAEADKEKVQRVLDAANKAAEDVVEQIEKQFADYLIYGTPIKVVMPEVRSDEQLD